MGSVGSTAFTYTIYGPDLVIPVPSYTVTDGSGCPLTASTKELLNHLSSLNPTFIVADWVQSKLTVSTTDIESTGTHYFYVKVLAGNSVNQEFTFTLTIALCTLTSI